ncbi:LamG domain-containing protein [Streptomyces sp. S063]|uniref:LamG domain-containing protein n=1 Tax=Streptomyces sp. S063 TaxID=2005885 RepID=UPI0010084D54|nr:LamG domain-containing protein [Streptomyces sp. S063]
MRDKALVRSYRDRTYVSTAMVRHNGTTVAFAMDDRRRIYYSVLDLEQASAAKGELDAAYWNAEPALLPFPSEFVDSFTDVPVVYGMPVVKAGGSAEVRPQELFGAERDPFLSTTARLTEAAPIQVVSDGRYLLVFRQSIAAGHGDAVYRTTGNALSGDAARSDYALAGGAKVAAADASLLCDRFVLVGSKLKPVVEARYQRSRSKYTPAAGGTDTLGTRDMDGKQFYEPTAKLSFLPRLTGGGFAVLLLPTEVEGVSRWQLFVNNAAEKRIESFNCERGADGLFDVAGTQLWTSPDPKFRRSVLEREPGTDPNTGRPLVPVPATTDRAGTALQFYPNVCPEVRIAVDALPAPSGGATFEAWVRPTAPGGTVLASLDESAPTGFRFGINGQYQPYAAGASQGWQLTSRLVLTPGAFAHLALVANGTEAVLYVDGVETARTTVPTAPVPASAQLLGRQGTWDPATGLVGDIDEVRIWNRARTAADLVDRGRRLLGTEPGLVTYLRLDEGAGLVAANLVDRRRDAAVNGAAWTTSEAPVGDGPGLSRDLFAIKDREVVGGLTATLYYQQEQQSSGYGTVATEKRQARVLLACATSGPPPQNSAAGRNHLCTLDLALGRGGRLAALPREVVLDPIGVPEPTKDLDLLAAAEAKVTAARAQLGADWKLADDLPAFLNYLTSIWNMGFRRAERDRLVRTLPEMVLAQARLGQDRAEVTAAEADLARLSGGMRGGADVVLPMPRIAVDRAGLSAYGALLTFAWTNRAPSLLDSANGDVVLYYAGVDGQFFSVYYPTTVSRATRRLTAGSGALSLVSRDPGARTGDFSLTVSPSTSASLCTVEVVSAAAGTERFPDVPRAAADFARVLGGRRVQGALLGKVATAQDTAVELAEPLVRNLPEGTAVTVGGRLRTVKATVTAGGKRITLTAGGLGDTSGTDVYGALYDYGRATCSVPGASLSAGSRIVGVTTAGVAPDEKVADGSASDGAQPLLPRWRGDAPGRALTFGSNDQHLTLPQAQWPKVSPEGDVSVEAWISPVSVNDHSRIWHANAGQLPYSLAIEEATEKSAVWSSNGGFDVGSRLALAGRDFTIEAWVHRDPGEESVPLRHNSDGSPALVMGIRPDNRAYFGWGSDLLIGGTDDNGWHSWSAVYEAATRRRTLYRDGVQVAQDNAATPYQGAGRAVVCSGTGKFDEIRVWGKARSADEIKVMAKRRITGRERDLAAYWTFTDSDITDRSGHGHDGTPTGQKWWSTDLSAPWSFRVVAGVGSQVVASRAAFPLADWSHVAATFHQDWALALDGTGYLDAGGPEGLDLTDELTIEAFIKVNSFGTPQGLVAKGALGTGTGDAVPYAFFIDSDGQLAFTFEGGDGLSGSQQTYKSGTAVPLGAFTKVAVTRRPGDTVLGATGIRFYIDGKLVGSNPFTYKGAKPVGNDANCEIGRFRVRSSAYGLRGTLAQVRIWNIARPEEQIGVPIAADTKGLVAWWRFPERSGAVTADACGAYPAQVRGANRVRTPDPAGNRITLYHNGVPSASDPAPPNGVLRLLGKPQVTVGAMQRDDGSWTNLLGGGLDELRIWRTCRTQEQILDNMFTRLRGEQQDLLAYYPIDPDSAKPGATVTDAGPAGCHLYPSNSAPGVAISHAPISDDSAQVRSALTGARTVFQSLISATPQAGEYADLQTDSEGLRFGVMKRAYSAIRDGAWTLTTGYKVGDLATTWVGQAQFAPQLVGYLEGAPPVPSENLVKGAGDDFKDASSVKFVQANAVTNTLASDNKTSFDASAKAFIKATFSDDTYLVAAPLGAGVATPASSMSLNVGVSAEFKSSGGWNDEVQVVQGATTTRTSEVTLSGYWEPDDAKKQVNPTVGRRWVPANTGFAFVQSDTADQYALRLTHNGALVAYRMVPNPDIPTDWNIIPFPINPQYTKQGTLDGLVGYFADPATGALNPFPDPDFPKAGGGDAFSYYRPREAYALKRRIQREERQLQGFYDSISANPMTPDPIAAAADRVLKGMMGGTGTTGLNTTGGGNTAEARTASRSAAKRNIANTYVWTAAGGLFSEVTNTTDQVTQTTTGEYSVSSSATLSVDGSMEFKGIGVSGGYEITLGAGYSSTRRKSKDATRTFSLEVTAKPGSNLQKQDAGNPVYDAKNRPVLVPGRVDAYRFMTFYLDTSSDNFEDFYGKVVDPEWLETGTSAHARELARARQGDRKPPCWRVLHRVTYVSRVLDTTSGGATGYAQALGALGLASDHQLFTKLQPYLTGATGSLADLTSAATTALKAHFPTLVPHTATIIDRLAAYHQLPDTTDPLVLPAPTTIPTAPPATPTTPAQPAPARAALTVPASSPRGTQVSVGYTVPPELVMPKNWVGIFPAGAAINSGSLHWQYTPDARGAVGIPDSEGLGAGRYQLWLLANDGYTPLAGPYDLTIA